MSAKKAMLENPELDYNLQYSHYNGTVKNQLAADYAEQRQAISHPRTALRRDVLLPGPGKRSMASWSR